LADDLSAYLLAFLVPFHQVTQQSVQLDRNSIVIFVKSSGIKSLRTVHNGVAR